MNKVTWNTGAIKPTESGFYFRKSGITASDLAYFDGDKWYGVKKKRGGVELIHLTPHKDQERDWHLRSKKIIELISPGDRFQMLTFVENISKETDKNLHRWMALFRCDCGNTKAMNLYEVRNKVFKSCGCMKDSPERIGKHKIAIKKYVESNITEITERNRKLGKSLIGKKKKLGPNGAWKFNIHAVHWDLENENGLRMDGYNLANLIRENAEFFDPNDLVTAGSQCNAYKRLCDLHQIKKDGKPVRLSWKGWRLAAPRVDHP